VTPPSGAACADDRRGVFEFLETGEITVHGRFADSSNMTLLVSCTLEGEELLAVYKPARGERPLWDFPSGLHRREVAAYALSETLGWGLVPETIERHEAPFGTGSIQRLVPEDGKSHYFTLKDEARWRKPLLTMAAFDVVANNADRKSGHVLLAEDRLWGIDHGLCFHCDPKLRTVIWDFGGEALPKSLREDLEAFVAAGLPSELCALLDDEEQEAVLGRAARLVQRGKYPRPADDDWRPYPWPLV
jgi:uncharacterized repeat protein (TIGR03843 family)